MTTSPQEKLLIIDGNALMHRAYHALPEFKSKNGTPTNAVYGFASVLHKLQSELLPSHILVCFDTAEPTFRDELFAQYRTQRPETHEDLIRQFPMVEEFLSSAGIPFYKKGGFEADDLIAVAARSAREKGLLVTILTGDKDIFQLVNDHIHVLTPSLGFSQGKLYDTKAVLEKCGVTPERIPDFKALAGDPSDNYKGVKGIGPKTAAQLINEYGSVENLYDNLDTIPSPKTRSLLQEHKDHALLSKKLAVLVDTIDDFAIDIDSTRFSHYNEALHDFCDAYEFRTLEKRFFPVSRPQKAQQTQTNDLQPELF